jgi:hypothetical protein
MKEALHQLSIIAMGFGFLAAFAAFWCFVLWLISRLGGWSEIAGKYPATARPDGLHLTGRSLRLRPFTNYNGCLHVTLSPAGIYMFPWAIFRIGHKPILIPWSCVGLVEEGRFIVRYYSVPIEAGGKRMVLSIPGEGAEWIRRHRPAS